MFIKVAKEARAILVAFFFFIAAKDILKRRQKLIQLADTSELGWRMVAEYESNPIASDSEDEKRIHKAEYRASRKAKGEKTKRGRSRSTPYGRGQPRGDSLPSQGTGQTYSHGGSVKKPGLCFICGKAGHWKNECSLQNYNNKISSFIVGRLSKALGKTNTNRKQLCFAEKGITKIVNINCIEMGHGAGSNIKFKSGGQNPGKYNEEKETIEYSSISENETIESPILNIVKKGASVDLINQSFNIEDKGSCTGLDDNASSNYNGLKKGGTIDSGKHLELTGLSVLSPVGKLKQSYSKWEAYTNNAYILDVIYNGYKLPLAETPVTVQLNNNRSARDNPIYVKSEIGRLVEKGIISVVQEQPLIVNPLTVAYGRSGKPRLVLDCRHINPCLHLFKVKFEDVKVAKSIFQPFSYVFTFDLKSAYHHIDICSCHRTYLGFSWSDEGIDRYYVFNCLPFGLSTAGHIFTKVLRQLLKYWRSLCIDIVMFLDDGIGGHTDFDLALRHSKLVRSSLVEFGFLLAEDKCDWLPRRIAIWLGHVFNFEDNILRLTEERIKRLETQIDSVLYDVRNDKFKTVHVKALASVIGQIISLQSVLGKRVSLHTRNLYICIMYRCSWKSPVQVNKEAIGELNYWRINARRLNDLGCLYWQHPVVKANVFADASSHGYGGFVEMCNACLSGDGSESAPVENTVVKEQGSRASQIPGNCELVVDRGNSFDRYIFNDGRLPEASAQVGFDRSIDTSISRVGGFVKLPEESCYCLSENVINIDGRFIGGSKLRGESCLVDPGCENYLPEERYLNYCGWHEICKIHPMHDRNGLLIKDRDVCSVSDLNIGSHLSNSEIFGSWTSDESLKSSTWRELEAVHRVVMSNLKILKNRHIKIFSDNQNVERILHAGSRVNELHNLSLAINSVCEQNRITFNSVWIPRGDNLLADHLSRCQDSDDWSISEDIYRKLDKMWGPHDVDRFSTHYNNKCRRFNSRWWVPGTEAIDAFDQTWRGELNWLVPPPKHIMSCLRKLASENARGTLIIPKWQSAPFWPFITDLQNEYKYFVKGALELPKSGAVCKGKGNNGMFGENVLSFSMVALHCVFEENQ